MRLIAYILAGLILAQPAWAQGRRRARMLEEEVIQGKVQKPNIEIIIARQTLGAFQGD